MKNNKKQKVQKRRKGRNDNLGQEKRRDFLKELKLFNFTKLASKKSKLEQRLHKKRNLPRFELSGTSEKHLKNPVWYQIAKYIKKNFMMYASNRDECIFVYNEGLGKYERIESRDFPLFVAGIFNKQFAALLTPQTLTAIFRHLVSSPLHQIDITLFDRQERFIGVANGVFDITEAILLPHNPRYGFTKVLPIAVKQKHLASANRPKKFLKALKQSFPNKDDRRRFLECCGYYISNCSSRKVAFIFLGKPHSGKSALLRLLTKMVGEENVSHLPLRRLGDRFAIAQLAGKKLNICGETGSATIRNLDIFKALLGNDNIEAEFKGRDMFSFSGRCKCLFAANKMPLIDDRIAEDAIFDRFEFIEFAHAIPPEKQIPDFENTLLEDEGSQILGLMISALRSWYRNGRKFTESKASTALKKQFIKQNKGTDFVKKFLKDRCKFSSGFNVSNSDLYEAYRAYCGANCFPALEPRTFIKKVLQDPRMTKHRFHPSKNVQYYGIKGLCLKKS